MQSRSSSRLATAGLRHQTRWRIAPEVLAVTRLAVEVFGRVPAERGGAPALARWCGDGGPGTSALLRSVCNGAVWRGTHYVFFDGANHAIRALW